MDVILDQLASGAPAPGGGAAAALTGAASAALVGMVCRVAVHHSSASLPLAQALREADELRGRLVALMGEDAAVVSAMLHARRAPGAAQEATLQEAVRRATEVPLAVAEASQRVLWLADHIAAHARLSTVADLGVAAILAAAALEAALLLVRVNVRDVGDPIFASRVHEALQRLAVEAVALRHQLTRAVATRTGVSA